MVKVIIVDDEYLLRQLIRNSIDWEKLGFEIVAEAEDGIAALEIIEDVHPQLAIVDINMPFMNGLELSKCIKEKYPDIRIIVLTGYGEFEYAKEAITIGITNYILKPINKEELEEVVLEAKKSILKQAEQKKYIDTLKYEVKSGSDIQKDRFLHNIITMQDGVNNESLMESVVAFKLGISDKDIVVAVIEIDHLYQNWSLESDRQLWKLAVQNISSEIMNENNTAIAFICANNYIVCMMNEKVDHIDLLSEKIRQTVKHYLDFTITVGIGTRKNGYDNIYLSYTEAVTALNAKFIEGNDKVLQFSSIEHTRSENSVFIIEDKNDIFFQLRLGNNEGFIKKLNFIFESISERKMQKQVAEMVAAELSSIPFAFIIESNLLIEDMLGSNSHFIECIKSCETLSELQNLIVKLYENTVTFVLETKRSKPSQIVEKAINYIDKNYSNQNLSLEEIAESIFINSSYLSKVFKRELQLSVIEHLTDCRMKTAQKIIQNNPKVQLSEVAKMVGYSDPYYFSKSFKKHFGMSPSKYMGKTASP